MTMARSEKTDDIVIGLMAALAASIFLLENGGKRAAASDKMFYKMISDYKRALEKARIWSSEEKN